MSWYLRTHYLDPPRGTVRERHYLDNGEVWLVVGDTRELLATLTGPEVEAARAAVAAAGLEALDDRPASRADQAVMTYEWRLPDSSGTWVDAAYPADVPTEVDQLEEVLLGLEGRSQ